MTGREIQRGKASTMPEWECPLNVGSLICRAGLFHPQSELITLHPNGKTQRNKYGEIETKAQRLAIALQRKGVRVGDVVSTLMYSNFEHVLLFYTLARMGVCIAPLNRSERITKLDYLIDLVKPKAIFVDLSLIPVFQQLKSSQDPHSSLIIAINDSSLAFNNHNNNNNSEKDNRHYYYYDNNNHYPSLTEFMRNDMNDNQDFIWPRLDERSALGIAFTSGSTGPPKGVVYSHRSTYISLLCRCSPDRFGYSSLDVLCPMAPLFHALGWLTPYTALLTGANYILTNDVRVGPSLVDIVVKEKVTFFAGVTSVVQMIRDTLEYNKPELIPELSQTLDRVEVGGTTPPKKLMRWFEENLKCEFIHSWGMTEINPTGTIARRFADRKDLSKNIDELLDTRQHCGLPIPTIQMRVVDLHDFNKEQPWDGHTRGLLLVRGPHVTVSYFGGYGSEQFWTDPKTGEKWLNTGDIVVRNERGQIRVVDRKKDVIKTGGEWISSRALETHLCQMDAVLECAVVAIHSDKWTERPVAVVTLKSETKIDTLQMRKHFMDSGFKKFEIPDELIVWESLPRLATGKLSKMDVRKRLKKEYGFRLPGDPAQPPSPLTSKL